MQPQRDNQFGNNFTGNVPQPSASLESNPEVLVNSGDLEATPQVLAARIDPQIEVSKHHRKVMLIAMLPVVLACALVAFFGLYQYSTHHAKSLSIADSPSNQIDRNGLPELESDVSQFQTADRVDITGTTTLGGGLVITPSLEPSIASTGQIYYDVQTDQLRLYDGSNFRDLITGDSTQTICYVGANCGFLQAGDIAGQTLPQGLAPTDTPTFAGLNLSGALSVANGGTGTTSFNTNVVLLGNGTGQIISSNPPSAGQLLVADATGKPQFVTMTGSVSIDPNGLTIINADTVGASQLSDSGVTVGTYGNGSAYPIFTVDQDGRITSASSSALPGGGSGVGSVNGLVGALTLQGTTNQVAVVSGGTTITISTAQDINTSSSPAFAGLTVAGTVTGGSFSGNGSALTALNGSNISSGTIANGRLTGGGALTVTAGTGLSGGGSVALGGTTTLNVVYGATATSAVAGNTVLNCPSGIGNLSGGGNAVTLGSGGTCASLNTINNPSFSGAVTLASLIFTGAGSNGTLQVANLGQATTYTLPDPGGASATICLTSGNCAGVGGGITGSGTAGSIAKFNGTGSITNSLLSESGTTITTAGDVVINASHTLNVGGAVTGASFAGDGSAVTGLNGSNVASGTVANARLVNAGALTVTAGTGLGGGGSVVLGGTTTLNVLYGSSTSSAVAGNTILNCPTGTGNLTGGGTAITLGSGGTCGSLTVVNNPTFTTSVTTPQAILTGAGSNGIIQVASLGQTTTYTLPNPGSGSATICLTSGNCAGVGGGITGSGTAGRISKFSGSGTIADSILSESGSTLTNSGALVIQGTGGVTIGTASSINGGIAFKNGTNANTLNLISGATAATFTLTLPTADGLNGNCLTTNGGGALAFSPCLSGGGGSGVTTLDGLSGVLTVNNSTGSGSAITINDATTGAKGIASFNSTNFTVTSGVVNTVQNINSTASPTFAGSTLTGLSTAGIVTNTSGGVLGTIATIPVGNGGTGVTSLTPNGVLFGGTTIGATAVGTTGQCLVGNTGAAPAFGSCAGTGTTFFTLAGSTGTSQAINGGDTVTIAAGSNITSVAGATDTITVSVVANPTFAGVVTASAGLTITTGQSLTINGAAVSNLAGTGLAISGGALQSLLGTSVDLAAEVTGILPIANGGTNAATSQGAINNISQLTTNGDILYYNGTNSTRLARGANNQCLLSNSTTVLWGTCVGDGTGVTTIGALNGGTANANGATISGANLYLQSASASFAGLVDTTTQTIAGAKTFSNNAVIGGATNATQLTIKANASQSNGANPLILATTSAGAQLFRLTTTESNSIYLGADSSYALTSGTYNTGIGGYTLRNNLTGSLNTAVGSQALYNNLNSDNTAVGASAGYNLTFGGQNTAIGSGALYSNQSGTSNIAIGYQAQRDATGNNNVSIGMNALYPTTGSNNTALGYQAGDNITSGSNNVIIGYDLDAASATGNNQLNIAGILQSTNYATGNLTIGTSDTTGQLLVIDTKTGAGDPTGVNGGMYYNSNAGKFRCYQAGAWADCITATGGVTTVGALNGGTANANGATISGTTLYLQSASATNAGLVDTATQTFAGAKTFNNDLTAVGSVLTSNIDRTAAGTLTIGTTTATAVTVGNSTGASVLNLQAGAGNVTGDINLFGSAGAIINIGANAVNNKVINIGSVGNIVNGSTVNIANTGGNATQGISIGSIANANNVVLIRGGTTPTAIQLQTGAGGAISLANTTAVGTVNIGTGATGAKTVNIGSTASTGTVTLQSGTGGILLRPSGADVSVGTSDTTGTLLVIDTKTDAGDPTGVNGGMYYNSNTSKFRCYEGSAWVDCIATGGATAVGALNGGTANANGATISGSTVYLQSASATYAGLVDTTTQTFAGNKTFNGSVTLSGTGGNQSQLVVRANSGQTTANPLILAQTSAGTELFRLSAPDTTSIFLGYNAGAGVSAASTSVGIGYNVLSASSIGADNTAIGYSALAANFLGAGNVAIGVNALKVSANGSNNIAIGLNSMQATNNGGNSVAIGKNSLFTNINGGGSVAIGDGAGYLATGGNNILIGYQAGDNITTGNNNIILGYDLNAGSATGSSQLNIAGLLTSSNYASAGLTVNGTVAYTAGAADSNTAVCSNSLGQLAACTSSQRYKDNVTATSYGLNQLRMLQPVTYTWNTNGQNDLGFIAEQVAQIIPQAVTYDANGQVASFNPNTITALLVSSTKQLDVKVTSLEGRLSVLEQGNLPQLSVTGNATIGGNLKLNGKLVVVGNRPTLSIVTATSSDASVTVSGNDSAGSFTVTTTSNTPGDIRIKLHFATTYDGSGAPIVLVTPVGSQSAAKGVYVDSTDGTDVVFGFSAALGNNQTYKFNYSTVQAVSSN